MDFLVIPFEFTSLGLSSSEMIVLGLVNTCSNSEKGVYYGTEKYASEWACCTDRNVRNIFTKLEEMGLISKEEITHKKRKKIAWRYTGKNFHPEKISASDRKNFPIEAEKISANNKIDNKDIYKNISTSPAHTREDMISEFRNSLLPYSDKYTSEMLEDFADYWAAPLQHPTAKQIKDGILLKYQKEETWSLEARLRNWAKKEREIMADRARKFDSGGYFPRPAAARVPDFVMEQQRKFERDAERAGKLQSIGDILKQ